MEDEKRRNQTPTVRKINYSKLLLFSKLSFKNNPHKNNYLSSKSTSKKAYFKPKKKPIHINKKLIIITSQIILLLNTSIDSSPHPR